MRVKDSLKQVIGKTLSGVVVCRNPKRSRLFLAFEDGTSFEFWVPDDDFSMAKGIDQQSLQMVIEILGRESRNEFVVFDHQNRHQPSIGERVRAEGCRLAFEDVTPDEAMHLAACHRLPFLHLLHKVTGEREIVGWAQLLVRAFANLLINENIADLNGAWHRSSGWHEVVKPPSVLPCELMYFLGGLDVANQEIARYINTRGAVQAYKRCVDPDGDWFATGRTLWQDE
jgi:hypothetical protein